MAGKRDESRAGDLLGRPLGVVVHLVRFAGTDETRHAPPRQALRDGPSDLRGPPRRRERGRVVTFQSPRPLRLREAIAERRFETLDEALHAVVPGGGDGRSDRLCGRRLEIPCVRLVAAEDERPQALWRMLAEREAEPGSPRGAEEVHALDPERVENRDSVCNARRERVRARLVRLVTPALTAVIGEDQAELAAQGPREARGCRNLQWVSEAGVEENRRGRASRVLEVGADAVHGVRRVRHCGAPTLRSFWERWRAGRGCPRHERAERVVVNSRLTLLRRSPPRLAPLTGRPPIDQPVVPYARRRSSWRCSPRRGRCPGSVRRKRSRGP